MGFSVAALNFFIERSCLDSPLKDENLRELEADQYPCRCSVAACSTDHVLPVDHRAQSTFKGGLCSRPPIQSHSSTRPDHCPVLRGAHNSSSSIFHLHFGIGHCHSLNPPTHRQPTTFILFILRQQSPLSFNNTNKTRPSSRLSGLIRRTHYYFNHCQSTAANRI